MLNINTKINIYLEGNKQIEAIIDTGSPIIIIDEPTLTKSFLSLKKRIIKDKKGICFTSVGLKP
jgi:hypothetical protein